MPQGINYAMADLYPGLYNGGDTSTLANPGADDQEALNENPDVTNAVSPNTPTVKSILLAIGVIAALTFIMGR